MAAALQQTPITFQSRSPPSAQSLSRPTVKFSLSSNLKPPKLTVRPLLRHRGRGGGASGARMADTATGSYANALPDVARSNNNLEQTSADAENLNKLFSDEAVLFLHQPHRRRGDQARGRRLDHEIVDMKRTDLVKGILKEFELVYNALTEMELALVTSVVSLEAQHLAQIAKEVQKLTGAKNVGIKMVIDSAVVAGFTIRYRNSGSKLIDMSVKKQLEEIATELDLGDIQLVV